MGYNLALVQHSCTVLLGTEPLPNQTRTGWSGALRRCLADCRSHVAVSCSLGDRSDVSNLDVQHCHPGAKHEASAEPHALLSIPTWRRCIVHTDLGGGAGGTHQGSGAGARRRGDPRQLRGPRCTTWLRSYRRGARSHVSGPVTAHSPSCQWISVEAPDDFVFGTCST